MADQCLRIVDGAQVLPRSPGTRMRLIPHLEDAFQRHCLRGGGAGDIMLLGGGTIPDGEPLRRLGVNGVFLVGTFTAEMVDFTRAGVDGALPP